MERCLFTEQVMEAPVVSEQPRWSGPEYRNTVHCSWPVVWALGTFESSPLLQMVKKNLSRLKKQACPCQNDVEDWKTTGLVRVRERYYYEQQHKEKQKNKHDRQGMGFSFGKSGPTIPETDDGTEITHENFPESNMVCPACEQEYVVMVEFVELEDTDKYKRKENPCDYCEGTGSIAGGHVAVEEEPCPECNGTGHNL